MSFGLLILINLGVALGMMTLLWNISVMREDASVVDPFWGAGFVVLAAVTSQLVEMPDVRVWLLLIMITLWGVRLSGYLMLRNHGKGEDRRYVAMREKRGADFWWFSLFSVFLLQGFIMWVVSLPVQVGMYLASGEPLGLLDGFGGLLDGCVGLLVDCGWLLEGCGGLLVGCGVLCAGCGRLLLRTGGGLSSFLRYIIMPALDLLV